MLHHTRAWRCEYGIAHDLASLALVSAGLVRIRGATTPGDRSAAGFARILAVTLAIEVVMAWWFHRVANPAEGVYYAADTEIFRSINRFTLVVVAILWPALIVWFWRARKVRS
jgi:hypothetical protein